MIPVPVAIVNGKLSGPLTPSLTRLLFKILPAARRVMMKGPILMRIRYSGHLGGLVLLLPKANHSLIIELNDMDIRDVAEELRADEGLGMLGGLEVP